MKYTDAKRSLRAAANRAFIRTPKDRPAIREAVNNHADFLCREINDAAMRGLYTEGDAERYKQGLHAYAGTLHEIKSVKR